jgi:hypothetical protein
MVHVPKQHAAAQALSMFNTCTSKLPKDPRHMLGMHAEVCASPPSGSGTYVRDKPLAAKSGEAGSSIACVAVIASCL